MLKWKERARAQIYRILNRRGFRSILATSAAIQASIRVRGICSVSYDGAWIQKFPTGILVEPSLRLTILPEIEKTMQDTFMHQYQPRAGDIVVDIGAGPGWEALCFSRMVGESGRVIAVEAHPRIFACLDEMCRRNKLRNVTAVNCAITAGQGSVLIGDEDHYMSNSILNAGSGISVLGLTLDTLFRSFSLPRVDLLAMNIEGAERLALGGMTEVIRHTRYVAIGCHDFRADLGDPEEMRTKSDVISFLEKNGFELVLRSSDPIACLRDCVYGLNRNFVPAQIEMPQKREVAEAIYVAPAKNVAAIA